MHFFKNTLDLYGFFVSKMVKFKKNLWMELALFTILLFYLKQLFFNVSARFGEHFSPCPT